MSSMEQLNRAPTTLQRMSKYRPVSIAMALALGGVFAYERSGKAPPINCSNSIGATLSRDFIHTEIPHFASNMLALFLVSNLEAQVGSIAFITAMGSIILLSALLTMGLTQLFKFKCSIGFSGVLLGLMAFAMISSDSKLINWSALGVLILTSIAPLATPGSNISISGHLIGIVSGLAIGLAYRFGMKAVKKSKNRKHEAKYTGVNAID